MESKKPWQSKTIWKGLILAVVSFFPQVQGLVAENPQLVLLAIGGADMLLRFVTKGKIALVE